MLKKIAIFDIDGTIATKGKISTEIVDGFKNLHTVGYYTTVCTGRNYFRMKDALADSFDIIVSEDALISVEHGSKVIKKNGDIIFSDFFKENELEHISDFIKSNIDLVKFLWFVRSDVHEKALLWVKDEKDLEKIKKERSYYAEVFHSSHHELLEKMKKSPISTVGCKLENHIKVENLKLHFTRSEIDVVFQDGAMEFIRNIADKSKSITRIQEYLSVPRNRILVAGNAINDVEMLNMDVETRILVGDEDDANVVMEHLNNKENIIRIATPEKLGEYLAGLKD